MSIGSIILLAIVATAAVYAVLLYNGLVALKHGVAKSFANIDVALKQRHDELPKLVETCRQYMKFEQDTLERVVNARSLVARAQQAHDINALGIAEGELRAGLGHLFALAENYPDLKTDETFRQLQQRITALENTIADRREIYNEAVNNNNVRIEQFPDSILASLFNFKTQRLLKFSSTEKSDVNIAQLFQ